MEKNIRQIVRQELEPVLDVITDQVMIIINAIQSNMKDVPDAQRDAIINDIIKKNADTLKDAMSKALPEDFDKKLKEKLNDGK